MYEPTYEPWNEPRYERMNPSLNRLEIPCGKFVRLMQAILCIVTLSCFGVLRVEAQDNPLDKVHVPPPTAGTPSTGAPAGVDAPAATGGRAKPGSLIKMNVDMVLVPITVTD